MRNTDPIKIMDEIEKRHWGDMSKEEWQSLRAAIERQAEEMKGMAHDIDRQLESINAMEEELAQARARLIPESGDKSPEYCDGWNDGYAERDEEGFAELARANQHLEWARERNAYLEQQTRQKDARIARLELTLRNTADGVHCIDEARAFAKKALKETESQSLAAVKAKALRWAAENICKGNDSGYFVCTADDLLEEAVWLETRGVHPETGEMWLTERMEKEVDRIEREAREKDNG